MDQKRPGSPTQQCGKKKKNCQKYKESYTVEFPCLRKSDISENMVFCNFCKKNFNIAHGGRDDCRGHVNSKKHEECAIASSKTKDLTSFFGPKSDDHVALNAVKAECLFARFLIEHNIPIAAADHAKKLFAMMFPDSAIANRYSSGHTKTTEIIKFMAKSTVTDMVSDFNNEFPFSVSTDGSNDYNDIKHYPTLITYFAKDNGQIQTMLLSLSESSDNTGEGIFNTINSALQKKGLNWNKCVCFSSDNANTMMGKNKGVAGFILQKNANVILRGCPCHLLHIAAKKAAFAFFNNLETFLIDIFYFLDKSSKRKSCFKSVQQLYGEKPHKILKYSSTRWLSLLSSIDRILEQWEPLKIFFSVPSNDQDFSNKRFKKIRSCLESDTMKLNLLFLHHVLPLFTSANLLLQKEEPIIHKLKSILEQFFMDLLLRFVKPNVVADDDVKLCLSNINFQKRSKQKDDKELVIGAKTRGYIDEKNVCEETLSEFYNSVRKFYVVACTYVKEKLLIDDDFLKHAEIANVSIRKKVSFSSVSYIIKRFPFIVKESEMDKLEIEFAIYQADKLETIDSSERTDKVWFHISRLLGLNGEIKYTVLPTVMFAILSVPHSNATSERLFSLIRKNQTVFRPTLGTETLEAILIEKIHMSVADRMCYEKKFSVKDLKAVKQCTYKSLSDM